MSRLWSYPGLVLRGLFKTLLFNPKLRVYMDMCTPHIYRCRSESDAE